MIGRVLRGLVLGGAAGVLIAAAFVLGMGSAFMLRPSVPIPEDVSAPANFNIYGEVWRYVDGEYYGGRPEAGQITRGALDGLVASLDDPWALLAPDDVTDSAWLEPRFVPSLGAWFAPVTGGARILAVAPEGSADEAGLQAGDLIIDAVPIEEPDATEDKSATNDDDTGMDADAAAALFQPVDDEEPLINVLEAADEPTRVILLRSGRAALQLEVEPSSGSTSLPGAAVDRLEDGHVIALPAFINADGVAAVADAIEALSESGDESALVLDLRDNPGGDQQALAEMAGLFLSGPLWVEETRLSEAKTLEAAEPGRGDVRFDPAGRLVVLVNGGTVGEAEMLAAALAEQAAAVVVGEPTFGRATHSEVRTLEDGSLLRISTASWQTVDGLSVEEEGLQPDWLVSGRDEQREAALASAAGEPVPPQETEAEEASAGADDG